MKFLFASFMLIATFAWVCGMLVGAMLYTNVSCALAPKMDEHGKYAGPELHCVVPRWYSLPRTSTSGERDRAHAERAPREE